MSFLVFMFLKVWVFVNKTSYNVKKKTFNVKYTDVKQTLFSLCENDIFVDYQSALNEKL